MKKVLIGVNNLTDVDRLAYTNHCQFWYNIGKHHAEDMVGLSNPPRMSIDRMRNMTAKVAIDNDFDYVVFLDDDVIVPTNWYERLLSHNKDIIAGVTLIRGYPYHPMIFSFIKRQLDPNAGHWVDDYLEQADPETGLLECDAVGFSLCAIKVDVLRKLEPPYFLTGENHTEDVYFCNKAKATIPGCSVWVDTTVQTAHILGSDIIMPLNVDLRRNFDEAANPGIKESSLRNERTSPIIDPKALRRMDYAQVLVRDTFGEEYARDKKRYVNKDNPGSE